MDEGALPPVIDSTTATATGTIQRVRRSVEPVERGDNGERAGVVIEAAPWWR
jgi:hypothetical protein